MGLPTLSKAWQIDSNRRVGSLVSVALANQTAMSSLKESLKGFSINPWTVWGSCYGHASSPTFGNGDGVDHWLTGGVPDPTKLVWAGSGNFSWMVLRQAMGAGRKTALCIALSNASTINATVVLSPTNGFGTANGGTDGTASSRPTASDEIVLLNNSTWGGYTTSAYTWRHHISMSTDGECTRIAMMRDGASVGFWMVDHVQHPVTSWANPIVGVVLGSSGVSGVASYANLSTAANTYGKIGSDTCAFYMTYEAYGATGVPAAQAVPDDDSGEWPLFPIGLYVASGRHRGRKGELADLWWGSSAGHGGVTYPDDTRRKLVGFGNLALPWDGSLPWIWT